MKSTRRSLRKASDGSAFLILHKHEWVALEQLAGWATRLFMTLLWFADHKTGLGQVTYPLLAAHLTPAQPARGPRLYAPDTQAVRRMVREIEGLGILSRDIKHSDSNTALFFGVLPRYEQARPKQNLTPKLDPRSDRAERAAARAVEALAAKLDPQTRPPLQQSVSIHIARPKAPAVDKSREALKATRDAIVRRRAGGEK